MPVGLATTPSKTWFVASSYTLLPEWQFAEFVFRALDAERHASYAAASDCSAPTPIRGRGYAAPRKAIYVLLSDPFLSTAKSLTGIRFAMNRYHHCRGIAAYNSWFLLEALSV
jgi:hypothetical protein